MLLYIAGQERISDQGYLNRDTKEMRGDRKALGEVYLRKSESKCRGSGVLSMLSIFREQLMRTE